MKKKKRGRFRAPCFSFVGGHAIRPNRQMPIRCAAGGAMRGQSQTRRAQQPHGAWAVVERRVAGGRHERRAVEEDGTEMRPAKLVCLYEERRRRRASRSIRRRFLSLLLLPCFYLCNALLVDDHGTMHALQREGTKHKRKAGEVLSASPDHRPRRPVDKLLPLPCSTRAQCPLALCLFVAPLFPRAVDP